MAENKSLSDRFKVLDSKGASKVVSVIGGVLSAVIFDKFLSTSSERELSAKIIKDYDPEIAKSFGRAKHQLTEEHYQTVFKKNPILAQAKKAITISPSAHILSTLAAFVAGVAAGLGISPPIYNKERKKSTPRIEKAQEKLAEAKVIGDPKKRQEAVEKANNEFKQIEKQMRISPGIAALLASSVIGTFAGLLVRKSMHLNHREKALEDTAHGQIMRLKHKQQMAEKITAGDVFLVDLALHKDDDKQRLAAYNEFKGLDIVQQDSFMEQHYANKLKACQEIANKINDGARPHAIPFMQAEHMKVREEAKAKEVAIPQQNLGGPVEVFSANPPGAFRERIPHKKIDMPPQGDYRERTQQREAVGAER